VSVPDAATEKPNLSLGFPPERFPLSIQVIAPSGEVVFSKTLQCLPPGKHVFQFPRVGQRVTIRFTFSDGETAVFHDVFVA
jgi:hypothetical protein